MDGSNKKEGTREQGKIKKKKKDIVVILFLLFIIPKSLPKQLQLELLM